VSDNNDTCSSPTPNNNNEPNLDRSHYNADRTEKSCPQCSRKANRLVFRPLAAFGWRTVGGREYIQPWCTKCRPEKKRKAA